MEWHPPHRGVIDSSTTGGRPAIWAATGRSGGMSVGRFSSLNLASHVGDEPRAVAANRDRVRRVMGAGELIALSAVHGSDVVVVDDSVIESARSGQDPVADAVICDRPDVALLALGADCLTLAIAGDDDVTVGAVHCGWRGLVEDVVGATVAAMLSRRVRPARVVLGPAICGRCYPVPPSRVDELRARCSGAVASASVVTCADGQPGIDVRAGVRARLQELDVPDDAVLLVGGCTAEHDDLFSHRRDGITGRQGMVIVRPQEAPVSRSHGFDDGTMAP